MQTKYHQMLGWTTRRAAASTLCLEQLGHIYTQVLNQVFIKKPHNNHPPNGLLNECRKREEESLPCQDHLLGTKYREGVVLTLTDLREGEVLQI